MKDKGIGTGATIGIIIFIIAIAAGGYYAYSQNGESQTGGNEVPMGLMMPLSGDLAAISTPMVNGGELAATEINEAGGILENREVNLIQKDTETDPTVTPNVAQQLIKVNGAEVIVGPAGSGQAKAILETTIPNEVVQIGPSNTSAFFTTYDDNGYYFRTCLSDTLQAPAMTELALSENYDTASTLSVNNAYGTGFEEAFIPEFEDRDGEIVNTVLFDEDASSFKTEIGEANEGDPDVIILTGYHKNGATILKQAYEMGIMENTDWLLVEGLEDKYVVQNAGKTDENEYIADGIKGTTPITTFGPGEETFKERYNQEFEGSPGIYSAMTYDAVALAALATQEAGAYEGSEIKDYMKSVANPPGEEVSDLGEAIELLKQGEEINYQGVSSKLTFDDVGDVETGAFQTWWFENGEVAYGQEIDF